MGGEQIAPAVVAVVVACAPGPWFDETLKSLADQDYRHLSVLVVVVGHDGRTLERVADLLPRAHLVEVDEGTGFAEAANRGMAMVSGVAHVLVCHDDVALAPDVVRLLLEEAYRSNAGLTCPKCVLWHSPERLLSVGMGADRLGVAHPLVEPGELDQGQHDAVREVFLAPSGAVLVRADLWEALSGFDADIGDPGEDLDISWRAHLAGARVVVAPQAIVRHLEATRNGLRPGPPSKLRREEHRLRDLWTCYSLPSLALVAPVVVAFAIAESLWAMAHRRSRREVVVPVVALAGSLRRPRQLLAARHRAQGLRRTSDLTVWRSQSRGSARLRAVVRVRLERGHQLAWAAAKAASASRPEASPTAGTITTDGPSLTAGALNVDPYSTIGGHTTTTDGGSPTTDGGRPTTEGGSASEPSKTETLPRAPIKIPAVPIKIPAVPVKIPGLPVKIPGLPVKIPGLAAKRNGGFSSPTNGTTAADHAGPGANGSRLAGDGSRSVPSLGPAGGVTGAPTNRASGAAVPETGQGQRLGWRWSAATAGAVVLLLVIGSRDVLSQTLPLVGQLPSTTGGVSGWWRAWWSGPGPGGLGSTTVSPPGLFVMGALGILTLGSANVAVHIMIFGPLALGPLGVYVGARRLGSERGRLAATVLYAALPVPYDALSQGHWAGLVSYATAPWLISGLCSMGGEAPYPFRHWDAAWPRFLALGLGVALAASLAPALLSLVPLVGLAFFVASMLVNRGQGGGRLLGASVVVGAVAFVALAPWSLLDLRSWDAVLGAQAALVHPLGLSQVLRLQTGPYGGGVLSWALVVAAAIPVFIGRSWRLAWAGRLWSVVIVCMALAWAGSRGWFPAPPLELLLAPAGAALVFSVALGAASVETDLSGYRFGWRQFAPPFGALAAVAAMLPVVAWVANGQWDLPAAGAEQAYAFTGAVPAGDYRVLWVGSHGSLPLAAQGASDGIFFAASLDGLPSADQLWVPRGSDQSATVGRDLTWAEANQTTALGHLLAPVSVRYIVVPVGGPGGAAAARMVNALGRQVDLEAVGLDPSYQVFLNSAWLPVFSVLRGHEGVDQLRAAIGGPGQTTPGQTTPGQTTPGQTTPGQTTPGQTTPGQTTPGPTTPGQWATADRLQRLGLAPADLLPVGTSGGATFGVLATSAARVLFGSVRPDSWQVRADGRRVTAEPAGGLATSWVLPLGQDTVTVAPAGSDGQHLADVLMLLLWAVGIWTVRSRLRLGSKGPFNMANLELGSPSAEVMEIDWSDALDGQNVG